MCVLSALTDLYAEDAGYHDVFRKNVIPSCSIALVPQSHELDLVVRATIDTMKIRFALYIKNCGPLSKLSKIIGEILLVNSGIDVISLVFFRSKA